MSSKLHKKLERDIRFLEQNEVPMETSGVRIEKLDYDGDSSDEEKRLNDDDVRNLADALMKNDVFQGPLDLSKNNLTDLSCLYLKEALGRAGAVNITKLVLAKNKGLKNKAGILIGDALLANPEHPIEKISFKNVYLGEDGLLRILEACNNNKHLKKAHLGVVSATGMVLMSKALMFNTTLQKIKFQEHRDAKWDDECKVKFIEMLKTHKSPALVKVKFDAADKKDETDGHKEFKKEMEFFVKKIKKEHKNSEEFEERIESCSNEHMFSNLLKLIEDPDDHEKMPVRKFFNNTFGTLLNDAIFQLRKKQQKSKNRELLTMQGQVRFVAHFLQDHLPENEAMADSEEDDDQTDEA